MTERRKSGVESPFRKDTFLNLAFHEYDKDLDKMKEELEREYRKCGTIKMAKRWGFHPHTVYNSLRRLGISLYSKGWQPIHKTLIGEALSKIGGVEGLLKIEGTAQEIADRIGVPKKYLINYMYLRGYRKPRGVSRWRLKKEHS